MNETGTDSEPTTYSEKYKLLFRNPDNTNNVRYWLATTMNNTQGDCIYYGLSGVNMPIKGKVGITTLHISGDTGQFSVETGKLIADTDTGIIISLRPVVIIEGNVMVEKENNALRFI